jgi:hypothetical protein
VIDPRRFLMTSLAGALAAPVATGAQQADRVRRIGWLAAAPADPGRRREAFLHQARDLGYVENRNIEIEYRSAEGNIERLVANLARPDRVGAPASPARRGPRGNVGGNCGSLRVRVLARTLA